MRYSIIIPMYNIADYIENTLKSIINCGFRDAELLLVDDGSSDNTSDVASKYLVTNGISDYRIIRKANGGVSSARNAGLDAARGEYVIFCDGDDELGDISEVLVSMGLKKDSEKSFFAELDEQSQDMIVWPFVNRQDGKLSISTAGMERKPKHLCSRDEFLRHHLFWGYRMRLGSFAVRRELIEREHIRFDESCTLGEDVEFFMKLLLTSSEVRVLDNPYYIYNKHSGSLAYSYNIRRFEAPQAMKRVAEWANGRTDRLPEDIEEYIAHGLYVLHSMYAIESCSAQIQGRGTSQLWAEYIEKYRDVEDGLRAALKLMERAPYGVSSRRILVLRIGTRVYMRYLSYLRR